MWANKLQIHQGSCAHLTGRNIFSSIEIIDPSNKKHVPDSNIMNSYSYTFKNGVMQMAFFDKPFFKQDQITIIHDHTTVPLITSTLCYHTVKQQKLKSQNIYAHSRRLLGNVRLYSNQI